VAKLAEPACGYVDNNAKSVVVHISTGAASAEALRFFGFSRQREHAGRWLRTQSQC
jgi:hypothetical protein